MRRTPLACLLLAAAAIIAAEAPNSAPSQPATPAPTAPAETAPPAETTPPAEAPAQPQAEPAAAPATPPAPSPAPPPLPAPPQPEFVSPRQGVYGPIIAVPPAQRIAMLEAGGPVPATDPLVIRAAELLQLLTARYVEDAPRIAELTIRTCQAVRAAEHPASPLEMLDAAVKWKRPAVPAGNVPRRYEGYAALYRKLRAEGGKSHAEALSVLQPPAAPKNDAAH